MNAFELDAIAQVISRLARDDSTVVPASMQADLTELQELGYVELSPTTSGTVSVNLLCPGALLSSYFWSVWVPRHLLDRALKVSVLPYLDAQSEVQHCTVVFRIPGPREATREFLTDLSTKFPGHEPEIIAIQVGKSGVSYFTQIDHVFLQEVLLYKFKIRVIYSSFIPVQPYRVSRF